MKKGKLILLCCLLIFSLAACDWDLYLNYSERHDIAWDLQGTWVSTDPIYQFTSELEITNNMVKITGYSSIFGWNRPFNEFNKGTFLRGHSVRTSLIYGKYSGHEGLLFLTNRYGTTQRLNYYYTYLPGRQDIRLYIYSENGWSDTLMPKY